MPSCLQANLCWLFHNALKNYRLLFVSKIIIVYIIHENEIFLRPEMHENEIFTHSEMHENEIFTQLRKRRFQIMARRHVLQRVRFFLLATPQNSVPDELDDRRELRVVGHHEEAVTEGTLRGA